MTGEFRKFSFTMRHLSDPILPGATIGVLGSGQLGRMFAIAARELGYRIHIFSPETDSPAGQIGDREFACDYNDLEQIREFARGVDVVTFEFENVPAATTRAAAEIVPVRPDGQVLHTTQHRLREKTFLEQRGFPVTPFRAIKNLTDLQRAVDELGLPAILKTASFGYDGKGQIKISSVDELRDAFSSLNGAEGILEAFVHFDLELSIIAARTWAGACKSFPVFENRHARHILDVTVAPARISPKLAEEAMSIAAGILDALGVVGLLAVEMFLTSAGKILVNELAPRTHNSGHLTIEACDTSQFEQQVRAICGIPLGSTTLLQPAAMANLLGDLWKEGEPDWAAALSDPQIKLHLYGKTQPRTGRKMGHLTATARTVEEAEMRVTKARQRLSDHNASP